VTRDRIALGIFIAITLAVEIAASLFTASSVGGWYVGLRKPSRTPPGWLFGPVWTALYLAMAVAAWLVFTERARTSVSLPLWLFAIQLVLNGAWSALFFGLRNPAFGLAEILVLWVFVLLTLLSFWSVRPLAGALLIPYQLWVTYAAALNFAIWRLNR
jgi:benzodiazapine receptor